jgi:hypothetical protein
MQLPPHTQSMPRQSTSFPSTKRRFGNKWRHYVLTPQTMLLIQCRHLSSKPISGSSTGWTNSPAYPVPDHPHTIWRWGYYQGCGGRALGGHERHQGSGRGHGRNTFSPAGHGEHAIFVPRESQVPPRHIPPMLVHDLPTTMCMNLPHFNITKKFNNWNASYLCRCDIKDTHTSIASPSHWRKTGHDECYTCTYAQLYLNQGYSMSTKGMHKTALPLRRYT